MAARARGRRWAPHRLPRPRSTAKRAQPKRRPSSRIASSGDVGSTCRVGCFGVNSGTVQRRPWLNWCLKFSGMALASKRRCWTVRRLVRSRWGAMARPRGRGHPPGGCSGALVSGSDGPSGSARHSSGLGPGATRAGGCDGTGLLAACHRPALEARRMPAKLEVEPRAAADPAAALGAPPDDHATGHRSPPLLAFDAPPHLRGTPRAAARKPFRTLRMRTAGCTRRPMPRTGSGRAASMPRAVRSASAQPAFDRSGS